MLFQLDPDQERTVEFGLKNPYSIFGLEMGVGKTACALAVWEKVGGNLLVVCPSYLVANWEKEIRKFIGDAPTILAVSKGNQIYPLWDTDVAIVSFDLSQKAECFYQWADMVVVDEATYLKSMTAKRTETTHKYIFENSIKRVHLLTGTPIKNRVEEFYSLLAICNYNPKIAKSDFLERFPDSITFADHFSFRVEYDIFVGKGVRRVVKWEGIKNEEELKSYLRGIYIRFKSKLEEPVFKDVHISDVADPDLWDEYQAWAKDNRSVKVDKKVEAAVKNTPFTAKYVADLLEEVGKVVVFTDQRESCKELARLLGVTGITGELTGETRSRMAEDFQSGKTDLIVATIGSFSTGHNLDSAWNLVLNDPPWVPGDIQQAMFRILRRGQKKRCVIHKILGSPQAAYIYKAIGEKQKTIDRVV